MIWSVPRSWEGETCVILAGGPSLLGFDITSIPRNRARVIAINDSWRLCPWADALYFCDEPWWDDQIKRNLTALDGRTRFTDTVFRGCWIKGGEMSEEFHPRVRTLRFTGQAGLETDPVALKHGNNSGYAAINLAYHFGVKRIILLGYDMHVQAADCQWHDGMQRMMIHRPPRSHWHDEDRPRGFAQEMRLTMLPLFGALVDPLAAAGVEVINATPGSALKYWPYLPLEALSKENHDGKSANGDQRGHSEELRHAG